MTLITQRNKSFDEMLDEIFGPDQHIDIPSQSQLLLVKQTDWDVKNKSVDKILALKGRLVFCQIN